MKEKANIDDKDLWKNELYQKKEDRKTERINQILFNKRSIQNPFMSEKISKIGTKKELKEKFVDINLKEFLSKIKLLKQKPNYNKKGPYIYCAVQRGLNIDYFSSPSKNEITKTFYLLSIAIM